MAKRFNEIRIEGDVAYITLNDGHVALIDADDVAICRDHFWKTFSNGGPTYVVSFARNAAERKIGPAYIRLHRHVTKAPAGSEVDHEDHDGLNNRKGNLRVCTRLDNAKNKSIQKNNSTGFKGVIPVTRSGRYMARIHRQGKNYYLGTFDTPEEAAAAYDRGAIELHGSFAQLNKAA